MRVTTSPNGAKRLTLEADSKTELILNSTKSFIAFDEIEVISDGQLFRLYIEAGNFEATRLLFEGKMKHKGQKYQNAFH